MNESKPWEAPELRLNEMRQWIQQFHQSSQTSWDLWRRVIDERDEARRWARKFYGLSKGYAILADDWMRENAELRRRIAELEGQLEEAVQYISDQDELVIRYET